MEKKKRYYPIIDISKKFMGLKMGLYCMLFVVILGCDEDSLCPDSTQYHFFSADELSYIWEDYDSAMDIQARLASGELDRNSIFRAYGYTDTLLYLLDGIDTLSYLSTNVFETGFNHFCPNAVPMLATIKLESIVEESPSLKKLITPVIIAAKINIITSKFLS